MNNFISAQELKRRGIGAVDAALRQGPVHVIRRNQPSYVILSEAQYRRLVGYEAARVELWERLQRDGEAGAREAADIDADLDAERSSWDR